MTKSPPFMCGVKVGLCLPRRIVAICEASRPSPMFSASMTYQRASSSSRLALYVFEFITFSNHTRSARCLVRGPGEHPSRIINAHQAEPARGRRRALVPLVTRLQDTDEALDGEPPFTHHPQRAPQAAPHPPQARIPRKQAHPLIDA